MWTTLNCCVVNKIQPRSRCFYSIVQPSSQLCNVSLTRLTIYNVSNRELCGGLTLCVFGLDHRIGMSQPVSSTRPIYFLLLTNLLSLTDEKKNSAPILLKSLAVFPILYRLAGFLMKTGYCTAHRSGKVYPREDGCSINAFSLYSSNREQPLKHHQ